MKVNSSGKILADMYYDKKYFKKAYTAEDAPSPSVSLLCNKSKYKRVKD